MKVAIVTFWNSQDNYGQILQAFATQEFLKSIGHTSYIIKFLPSSSWNYNKKEKLPPKKTSRFLNINHLTAIIRLIFYSIKHKIINRYILNHDQDRKFNDFKSKYLHLSEKFYSEEDLFLSPPYADIYLCGSDQVWGGTICNKIYFLNFIKNKPKIAIAASFGQELKDINDIKLKQIKKYLTDFNAITLREEEGVKICKYAGLTNAKLICDPTILNNVETYINLLPLEAVIDTSDGVFIYYLGHNSSIKINHILKFASKNKNKVYLTTAQGYISSDKKYFLTIEEWLHAIYNAKFVVTNSFHGTVFSILFKKQFAVIPLKNKGANSRIETLLSKLDLTNRICIKGSDLNNCYNKSINYNIVTPKMDNIRDGGINLLIEILNNNGI